MNKIILLPLTLIVPTSVFSIQMEIEAILFQDNILTIIIFIIFVILIIISSISTIKIFKQIKKYKKTENKLKLENEFANFLIDSQSQIIITKKQNKLTSANRAFCSFFKVNSLEDFKKIYKTQTLSALFNNNSASNYIKGKVNNISWIDHIIQNSDENHFVEIILDEQQYIFAATAFNIKNSDIKSVTFTNITEIEKSRQEIETMNNLISDSLNYASSIQQSLMPKEETLNKVFDEHFTIMKPLDVIGGDIYFLSSFAEDEYIILFADCSGQSVSGAFATVLIKAVEEAVTITISKRKNRSVSTSTLMGLFNKTIKKMLKKNDINTEIDIGFMGGIIYYNKKNMFLKYTGAKMPLYYMDNQANLTVIESSPYTVGKSSNDYTCRYQEDEIKLEAGMEFYILTDGFENQIGGDNYSIFGRDKIKELIKNSFSKNMKTQKNMFEDALKKHQYTHRQSDDIATMAFKIK